MTSEQSQQLLNQAQLYQQQMQGIMIQKENLNAQLLEIKHALKELENLKGDMVYKLTGPIMIKANKEEIKKELLEKQELVELRLKSLEKGEKKAKDKIEELKEKLSKMDFGGAG